MKEASSMQCRKVTVSNSTAFLTCLQRAHKNERKSETHTPLRKALVFMVPQKASIISSRGGKKREGIHTMIQNSGRKTKLGSQIKRHIDILTKACIHPLSSKRGLSNHSHNKMSKKQHSRPKRIQTVHSCFARFCNRFTCALRSRIEGFWMRVLSEDLPASQIPVPARAAE